MLSEGVRIAEVDMPYHEREGESKLRVVRDGLRFLCVILEAAFLYRPMRQFELLCGLSFLTAAALMASPTFFYLQHRFVLEWMIYRFVVADLFGIAGVLCFSASSITDRIINVALSDELGKCLPSRLESFFSARWFWALAGVLVFTGVLVVASSFWSLLGSGTVYDHWSRFLVMSGLVSAGMILVITRLFHYGFNLVDERMECWAANGKG